jgi:uncharacterized membrane protein YfcA
VPWEWPVGALCAFLLALVTTPAGVSGAVLLLPIQLSVLHVPSPAVTPTNLLFNVAAVPGGLLSFWHERRLLNHLTWLLVTGTLPGVIAATFLTSIGGIVTYQILQATHGGTIAPDWALGAFLGAGGLLGSYLGARLQRHLPEQSLRRLLGLIACLVAARYIQTGVQPPGSARPAHTATR